MSLLFFSSGAGMDYDWPYKLWPWYHAPKRGILCNTTVMMDSGVNDEPPPVDQLVHYQASHADIAVCPDVLGDPDATARRTEEWLPRIVAARPGVTTVLCTQGEIHDRILLMARFPSVAWVGAGLKSKAPGVPWTDEEREHILRELVPRVHSAGKRFHAFGLGVSRKWIELFRELRVDSFDAATAAMAAGFGRVLDDNLRQVSVGGASTLEAKRCRLMLNLHQIEYAITYGFDTRGGRTYIPGEGGDSDA